METCGGGQRWRLEMATDVETETEIETKTETSKNGDRG